MSSHPLILTAAEVRAVLNGTKTQHRVRVKFTRPPPWQIMDESDDGQPWPFFQDEFGDYHPMHCPFGVPGDLLWVRETWGLLRGADELITFEGAIPEFEPGAGQTVLGLVPVPFYRADSEKPQIVSGNGLGKPWHWRPPLSMPRWASRITLAVESVRVQRLQDISEEDAKAEGARFHDGRGVGHSGWRLDDRDVHADARSAYGRIWIEKHGRESWSRNDWVFALTFKCTEGER